MSQNFFIPYELWVKGRQSFSKVQYSIVNLPIGCITKCLNVNIDSPQQWFFQTVV